MIDHIKVTVRIVRRQLIHPPSSRHFRSVTNTNCDSDSLADAVFALTLLWKDYNVSHSVGHFSRHTITRASLTASGALSHRYAAATSCTRFISLLSFPSLLLGKRLWPLLSLRPFTGSAQSQRPFWSCSFTRASSLLLLHSLSGDG
jgi:hypothetical protein